MWIENGNQKWQNEAPFEKSEQPQLVGQLFSMEAQHHIMMSNNSQILGM